MVYSTEMNRANLGMAKAPGLPRRFFRAVGRLFIPYRFVVATNIDVSHDFRLRFKARSHVGSLLGFIPFKRLRFMTVSDANKANLSGKRVIVLYFPSTLSAEFMVTGTDVGSLAEKSNSGANFSFLFTIHEKMSNPYRDACPALMSKGQCLGPNSDKGYKKLVREKFLYKA